MSSILRMNRDTLNIESINRTVLTTNQKLDQLISTSGSDEELLTDIKTELQTGNDNTSQGNQKLDNIIEEAELLKRQEVENSTDYDFDIFSEVIVPRLPEPPPNEYIKDPFGRNSWYLQNVNAGSTQLYWYATDAPFGYKSNSVLRLGQIVEGGGFYFALYLDKVDASLSLPIFGVYTTPTGSGDSFPSFYKSRVNYGIAGNQKLFSGELIVCYNSVTILDKIKNVLPTARRVLLTQTTSTGSAANDETIRYLTINNDSLTPLNDVRWSIVAAGWYDGSLTTPVLRHFRFTTTIGPTGEQQVNDTGTQTALQNTNEKIDTTNDKLTDANDKLQDLHDDIKDVENLLTDIKQVQEDIEDNTGTTADKLSQLSVFSKSLLVQPVQNNKIHHMMVSRSGGGDTSGPLIVASQRTTTHILPLLTAERFIVESSNDSNKIPNLGLYRVRIEGVGENGELDSEILDVNGVLGVETSKNYFHINKIEGILGNISSGQVFVKRQDGTKYCEIADNGFQVSNGFFMCPNGFQATISSIVGNDLTNGNLYFIKYNSNNATRNTIYRFFNRNNINLVFTDGIGLVLDERESFYVWNPLTDNDTTHYNIKIELVAKGQLTT